jgi:hypothetical protein
MVYAVIAVTRKFVAVGGLPRADLPAKAVLEARNIMSPKIMTAVRVANGEISSAARAFSLTSSILHIR